MMKKSQSEKLEYIAPVDDDGEIPGVSRYYREPPALASLVGLLDALLIGIGAVLAIGFFYLRRGF
jgi:hypothetical protein